MIVMVLLVNVFSALEMGRVLGRGSAVAAGTVSFILNTLPSVLAGIILLDMEFCMTPGSPQLSFRISSFSLLLPLTALICVFGLGRKDLQHAAGLGFQMLTGTLLIALGSAALYSLVFMPGAEGIILWLIAVVALNDTAAYFAGSNIVSPRIFPAISPNKSLIGFVAGICAGTLSGVLLIFLLPDPNSGSLAGTIAISLLCVLFAQAGDLAKSSIKRLNNVKDFGDILPGHGGVLDRADGILGAAIALNYFLMR